MESCLQHLKTRLHGGVAEGNMLSNRDFGSAYEVDGQQFDELVLHVLDKVQSSSTVHLHEVHCEVVVRLFDAVIEHADQHIGVVCEVHHELLLLLHGLETLQVACVRV